MRNIAITRENMENAGKNAFEAGFHDCYSDIDFPGARFSMSAWLLNRDDISAALFTAGRSNPDNRAKDAIMPAPSRIRSQSHRTCPLPVSCVEKDAGESFT